jgi:hypothetical protein
MTERLKVSKLDAARRQLETAILLYFNGADPVSIHTLATAAHEVLRNLGAKANSPMLLERSMASLPKELTDVIQKAMRMPQNFFKHADRDADECMDFSPRLTEYFILDAMAKYMELTGELTLMLKAYEQWFTVHNPEFWAHTPLREFAQQGHRELGTLTRMEFLKQSMDHSLPLAGGRPNPHAPADGNRASARFRR